MKNFILFVCISVLTAACAAPQQKSGTGTVLEAGNGNTFQGPYTLWGDEWAFRFSSVNKWVMQWEDAYKYEANAYFTLNGAPFNESDTIIAFYLFKHTEKDIEKVVAEDVEKFYNDYPGIRIEKFDFKNMDYDYYINEKKYPLKKNEKVFKTVMYDFTNSTVNHFDRYEFVVFFKINPQDETVCVLQLSSRNEDAFKYIEDLKFIYMTFEQGEIPQKENFY